MEVTAGKMLREAENPGGCAGRPCYSKSGPWLIGISCVIINGNISGPPQAH